MNSSYIDLLGIDLETATDAYANFVEFDIPYHSSSKLYDDENDNIKWELVPSTILYNSYCYSNLRGSSCSLLSSSEIEAKVATMRQVVEKVKEDFPSYDMKSFACNLEKCTITEEVLKEDTTIAEVSAPHIFNNTKWEEDALVDTHEDIHYVMLTCEDIEKEKAFSRVSGGVAVETMPYSAPGQYQSGYYNRFRYPFLEEIYAELYAAEITSRKQEHYLYFDEVLTLLQLVLGLQDNYDIDQILENLVYHDPVAFIQNFPVYGDDLDQYFVSNLQMLKACDILLRKNKWYIDLVEENHMEEKFSTEGIFELKKMALDQIEKTFFNQLILLNEGHKGELKLEDFFAMIKLFYRYEEDANYSLTQVACSNYNGEYDDIYYVQGSKNYQYKNILFQYLSSQFTLSYDKIVNDYSNYINQENYQFPNVLGSDKQEFYQTLFEMRNSYDDAYSITLRK